MFTVADHTTPGILETLPPWGLVVAGIVLVLLAAVMFLFNEKLFEGDSFLLTWGGWILGVGGVVALLHGLFGG